LPDPGVNINDAYLIGGDLYIWDGTDWNNVGQIQGPTGPTGPTGVRGDDSTVPGPTGPTGPTGATGGAGLGYAGITFTLSSYSSSTASGTVNKVDALVVGSPVRIVSPSNPLIFADGLVFSITGTIVDITVLVDNTGGTLASITSPMPLSIAGVRGATGPTGNTGATGPTRSTDISTTPPSSPALGDLWYNSETGQTFVYYDSYWVENVSGIAGPTGATGAGVPTGGASGQVLAKSSSTNYDAGWIDIYTPAQTDTAISTAVSNLVDSAPTLLNTLNELSAALNDDPNFSTTVATALAALVPAGTISQTARATAPTGYLICDGTAISRTTYSTLFDAIGTAYGVGDNSTTFNIPNLKGRVPVGRDSAQTEFDTLGEVGGAKTHTLTTAEMPSHTHDTKPYNTAGSAAYAASNLFISNGDNVVGNGGATTATGGGGAHNNLQPYVVLNYMIKV
jgi:microcystin-dependent protein